MDVDTNITQKRKQKVENLFQQYLLWIFVLFPESGDPCERFLCNCDKEAVECFVNAPINSSLNGLDVSFCPSPVTGNNKDLTDCLLLPVFLLASDLTQGERSGSWVLTCTNSAGLSYSPFDAPFAFTQVNTKREEEGGPIALPEHVQERLSSWWGGWSTWWKRRRPRGDLFAVLSA